MPLPSCWETRHRQLQPFLSFIEFSWVFRTETWLAMTHFLGCKRWYGRVCMTGSSSGCPHLLSLRPPLHPSISGGHKTRWINPTRKNGSSERVLWGLGRRVLSKKLFHSENTLITLLLSGFWFPHEDLMQEHQWGDLHYPAQRGLNLHLISIPGPSVNHGKRWSGSPALLTVVPLSRGWMQGSQFVVPKQCTGVGWMKSPGEL